MHNASRFQNYLLTSGNLSEAFEVYDHEIGEVGTIHPAGVALHFHDESIFFFLDPQMHRGSAASLSSARCFSAENMEELLERLFRLAEDPFYQPLQYALARALTSEEKVQ